MKDANEKKKNPNAFWCRNCAGGFRCLVSYSPCFTYYCGEYPGTGPWRDDEESDEDSSPGK